MDYGTYNLSQTLFMLDEKLMENKGGEPLANELANSRLVSNWATFKNQGISGQLPAYLNQSRMSTWYQDNGLPVLQFSNQFGLNTMGGPINPNLPQGSRPGGQIHNQQSPDGEVARYGYSLFDGQYTPIEYPPSSNNVKVKDENGIKLPTWMNLSPKFTNAM